MGVEGNADHGVLLMFFLKIALAIRRRQHLDSVDDVRVIHWDYTRSSYANPNSVPSRDDRIPDIRNQHQPVRYTRIVDFFYLIPLGFAGFLPYPGIRAELPTCFTAVCSVFIGIAPSFPILVPTRLSGNVYSHPASVA